MANHTWKKEETDYICENYNLLGLKLLHEDLKEIFNVNVSIASLSNKCRKLGYKTISRTQKGYHSWSEKDLEFLKNNYDKISTKDIALRLSVTENSITSKISQLQLNKDKLSLNSWSDYEKEYVFKNYKKIPTKDIALHLNRTIGAVTSYASRTQSITTRKNENNTKINDSNIDSLLSEYGNIE